jgi:hypothetical protein
MDGFDRMQVDTDLEQLLNPEFDLELPAFRGNITDLIGPPQPGASGMRFQHRADHDGCDLLCSIFLPRFFSCR